MKKQQHAGDKSSSLEETSKTSSSKTTDPTPKDVVQTIPREDAPRFSLSKRRKSSRVRLSVIHPEKPVPSQCWIKVREFNGKPRSSDFRLHNEVLPHLQAGEILTAAICWSVNPHQRTDNIPLGSVMPGEQLACVIKSKNPAFLPRSLVVTSQGWRSKAVIDPEVSFCRTIPDGFGASPLMCMNMLGLTGLMMYFGFMEVCCPAKNNVVLINSCSAYIGEFVGQLAKNEECTVILFTSSSQSAHWLRCLGFRFVYNYKRLCPTAVLRQVLECANLHAIDIFIDTVGSKLTAAVLPFLRPSTRTVIFGNPARKSASMAPDPDPYRFASIYNCKPRAHSVFDFQFQFDSVEMVLLGMIAQNNFRFRFQTDEKLGFKKLPSAVKYLGDPEVLSLVHVLDESYNSMTKQYPKVSFA